MKIVAVRIGDRYGPEYETYLESKLPEYEFIWIRESIRPDVKLQWNKMYGMNMDINEPICVMDIDVILTNDYRKIFDYPIKRGEFLALPGWWREGNPEFKINGGFFKYYPKDCKHIYDIFMDDVDKWQEHFIKNGITAGPVNGEQYFVEQHVRESESLELKLLPAAWFTRWNSQYDKTDKQYEKWQWMMSKRYKKASGNDYIWMGDFHEDIKFVHFTHAQNKPTDWARIGNEYK